MESLNLHQLSLIIDQELVIIPGDIQKHKLAEKLKARHSHHADPVLQGMDIGIEDPSGTYTPREEDREEYSKITYEGNFERAVLIIYQGSELESGSREFLMKILGAVGCSLKDVALLSASQLQESTKEIISQLNPHKCLIFGIINHPLMQHKRVNYEISSGETLYLFADDLKEIAENIALKKNLWTSLQVLFNINK